MRLLVLGGGGFLGYHVVEHAVQHGDEVTVLSRSGRAPLDGVETLTGDRTGDLDALRNRSWDAVIDTFTDDEPNAPAVRRTATMLSGAVGCYCYVSGMSVYAPDGPRMPDEQAMLRQRGHEPDDDPLQARSLAKLAGEAAVHEHFDGPVLVPRVGIMVGPRDPSHRFTWWPLRFYRALHGDADPVVLGPGRPDRLVQYSDARDIAAWLVTMTTAQRGGTFNTVGPLRDNTLSDVLDACLAAASDAADTPTAPPRIRWQPDEQQLRRNVHGVDEEDRPLWYPEDQIPQDAIDSTAAAGAGLTFRPISETAAQTLAWALRDDRAPLPDFREPR